MYTFRAISSWQYNAHLSPDSITNDFNKWSDAQRPAEQRIPAINVPEPRLRKGDLMDPDAGIVSDGN